MIRYNVRPHMERRGIENASQLAIAAGIPAPAAYRVLSGDALDRIEIRTLERLTAAFKLKTPWTLLEYVPDE